MTKVVSVIFGELGAIHTAGAAAMGIVLSAGFM
jgi:hypothetical protein